MKTMLCVALLCGSILGASAQALDPERAEFEAALAKNPKDKEALYNLGLKCYLSAEYKKASEHWATLKGLEPKGWKLRAKLVQAYWAAGEEKKAEKEVAELRAAKASKKHADLNQQEFFIRDQIVVERFRAFVIEYYELKGERPMVWKFIIQQAGHQMPTYYSVGSYSATTAIMREMGEIGKDERAYHMDEYGQGYHKTIGIYKKKPDYAFARKVVEDILKKEVEEGP